ncbi:hypothetical protein BDW72DRAFT_184876 [Aspergillus terricola var. indicus]
MLGAPVEPLPPRGALVGGIPTGSAFCLGLSISTSLSLRYVVTWEFTRIQRRAGLESNLVGIHRVPFQQQVQTATGSYRASLIYSKRIWPCRLSAAVLQRRKMVAIVSQACPICTAVFESVGERDTLQKSNGVNRNGSCRP